MKIVLIGLTLSILALNVSAFANSAVILMYHRFGEDKYPSTNIKIEQFKRHIQEFSSSHYNILPVSKILTSLKNNQKLPDRTVGITIDDGYKSIYKEAWPRLKKAKIPFTIFPSTGPITRGSSKHVTWAELKEMVESGVEIGGHTVSHHHMVDTPRLKNETELFESNNLLKKILGKPPKIFAYPFGEASNDIYDVVTSSGYRYAFGQHSGAIDKFSNFLYLPRFALNERFGGIKRLKLILNSLPLSVSEFVPSNPLVGKNNPPFVGFTVLNSLNDLNKINCFSNSEGRLSTTILGGSRVEIRLSKPFTRKRTRINCTLQQGQGRWFWLGAMFVLPKP